MELAAVFGPKIARTCPPSTSLSIEQYALRRGATGTHRLVSARVCPADAHGQQFTKKTPRNMDFFYQTILEPLEPFLPGLLLLGAAAILVWFVKVFIRPK